MRRRPRLNNDIKLRATFLRCAATAFFQEAKLTGRPDVREPPGRRRDHVGSACAVFAPGGPSQGAGVGFSSAPGSPLPTPVPRVHTRAWRSRRSAGPSRAAQRGGSGAGDELLKGKDLDALLLIAGRGELGRVGARQSQGERVVGAGPAGRRQVHAGVALIDAATRAHATLVPDARGSPLLPHTGLVLAPDPRGAGWDAQPQEPGALSAASFLKAACAAGSPFGCEGRVFWRERLNRGRDAHY